MCKSKTDFSITFWFLLSLLFATHTRSASWVNVVEAGVVRKKLKKKKKILHLKMNALDL